MRVPIELMVDDLTEVALTLPPQSKAYGNIKRTLIHLLALLSDEAREVCEATYLAALEAYERSPQPH